MLTKIPILQIEDQLVASIQVALDDQSVIQFQNDLLEKIVETDASGVVVDITSVDVVDSFMARSINDTAIAVHLLGTEMVIVGMQPAVAITLVEMGLSMPNASTALNLEKGLKLLRGDSDNGRADEGRDCSSEKKRPLSQRALCQGRQDRDSD